MKFSRELIEEIVNSLSVFGKPDYRFKYSEGDMSSSNNSQLSFLITLERPEQRVLFRKEFVLIGQENKELQKEVLRRDFLKEILLHSIFGYPVIDPPKKPY